MAVNFSLREALIMQTCSLGELNLAEDNGDCQIKGIAV